MTNKTQTAVSGTGIGFKEDDIEGTFLEVIYDALVCNSDEYSDGIVVFASGDGDEFIFSLTLGGEVNYGVHTKQPYSEELVEGLEQLSDRISTVVKQAVN